MSEEGTMEDYTVVNMDSIDLNRNIHVSLIRFHTRKKKKKQNTKTFSFWHCQDELNVSALVEESRPPAWFICGVTTWRVTDQRSPIFFPGWAKNWHLIGGQRAESKHTSSFFSRLCRAPAVLKPR